MFQGDWGWNSSVSSASAVYTKQSLSPSSKKGLTGASAFVMVQHTQLRERMTTTCVRKRYIVLLSILQLLPQTMVYVKAMSSAGGPVPIFLPLGRLLTYLGTYLILYLSDKGLSEHTLSPRHLKNSFTKQDLSAVSLTALIIMCVWGPDTYYYCL